MDTRQFIKTHIVLPFIIFLILYAAIEINDLDLIISRHFYNSNLHQWTYKNNWLASRIIHHYGSLFTKIVIAVMFLGLLATRIKKEFHIYSLPVAFLFIASILGPGIVIFLKNHTHIYCPWDLSVFGGSKPYIHLFDHVKPSLKVGHCFPAAHASGGFTFMSFYFFFILLNSRYKYHGLLFGLFLGLIYGFDQQIRGAHFLSHDLFAIAICWFSSVLLFFFFQRMQKINFSNYQAPVILESETQLNLSKSSIELLDSGTYTFNNSKK